MSEINKFNQALVDAQTLKREITFDEQGFIYYTDKHGRKWIYFPITERFIMNNKTNVYTAATMGKFFEWVDKWEKEKDTLIEINNANRKNNSNKCYKITHIMPPHELPELKNRVGVAYIDTESNKNNARKAFLETNKDSIILSTEKVNREEYQNFLIVFSSNYQDLLRINETNN